MVVLLLSCLYRIFICLINIVDLSRYFKEAIQDKRMATSEGKKKESSGGDAGTGSAAAESVSDKKNGDTSSNTATEANPKNAKYTPRPPPVANPAKFGKADPKRDILIFVGVMTVMFLISWELEDVGKPSTDPKKKSPLSQLKQMKKTLSKQFAEKLSINKIERWDCDLFVTKSSIPNVGLGIFAGKNYTKGDVIVSLFSLHFFVFLFCFACLESAEFVVYHLSLTSEHPPFSRPQPNNYHNVISNHPTRWTLDVFRFHYLIIIITIPM